MVCNGCSSWGWWIKKWKMKSQLCRHYEPKMKWLLLKSQMCPRECNQQVKFIFEGRVHCCGTHNLNSNMWGPFVGWGPYIWIRKRWQGRKNFCGPTILNSNGWVLHGLRIVLVGMWVPNLKLMVWGGFKVCHVSSNGRVLTYTPGYQASFGS
jgi:hypothetical protein